MRGSRAGAKEFVGWTVRLMALTMALAAVRPLCGEQGGELAESTRALYRGDYERAAAAAANYLKAHPEAPAARILLARVEIAQGKYLLAYQELWKVLRNDPRNIDALYYLGRLCGFLSQMEYQDLYALAPDSARVHQLLAESYEVQENTTKAEEEYQAALKANPRSVKVLDALGDLKRHQFRFDEAITYYSRAAEIEPRDYTSAYGLGASYLYRQEPERAIDYFRRALAVDPNSSAARLALGDALLRAGRPAPAIAELKAAVVLEPKMRQAYTLLARAYQRLGQSPEAEAALKKAHQLTRQDQEARQSQLSSDELPSSPAPPPSGEGQHPNPDD